MVDEQRRAVVTGAASGIGLAIAERLHADGARLVLLDVDAAGLAAACDRLEATPVVVDLADADAVDAAAAVVAEHLPDGLDVLVHAAGIADETPIDAPDLARLRRVLRIDLEAAAQLTLLLVPALRAGTDPRIAVVGSVQGERSAAGVLAYATSKGGLHAMTRSLAVDLADDGVLVNAVAPGFIDTPMAVGPDGVSEYDTDWFQDVYVRHGRIPLRRPGAAAEVAEVVAFLTSTRNTYVTGQVLGVDGGLAATF